MRTKLVYVLPKYDPDSPEHMYHIYGFLEAVAEHLKVWVIIERAQAPPSLRDLKVYRQRVKFPLLSKMELLAIMLWARLRGYERFYTHYSVSAGVLSGLVTRFLGGVSYYWNCGHPTQFVPDKVRSLSDVRSKMRNQICLSLCLHTVHHLVTGTATMARYYSESYGLPLESIRVMPNWVDLRRFAALPDKPKLRHKLGWPADKKVVLFLHRLAERKGAHHIVSIAREMLAQYPGPNSELLFVIAGDGPYRKNLEGEIQRAGLTRQFRLPGWIPNREAIEFFAAADVYMMPSAEEGFPRTLLEAMAAGCPFTAMDVGGVRDIVTPAQGEFVVPAGDWQRMASMLDRLLVDEALRQRLIADGRAHVQMYSQDRAVRALVAMMSDG